MFMFVCDCFQVGTCYADEAPSKQESESLHACEHERMLNGSTPNGIGTRFVGVKMDINALSMELITRSFSSITMLKETMFILLSKKTG